LIRHRIQIVEYGPSHAELASRIRELNPHRQKALTAGANRIRELVEGQQPEDVPSLRQLLEQLLPASQDTVRYSKLAHRDASPARRNILGISRHAACGN